MQFHVGSINLPVLTDTLFLQSIFMHDNTCRGVLLKLGFWLILQVVSYA